MSANQTVLLVEDATEWARAVLRAVLAAGFAPTIAPSCAAARGVSECALGVFEIELRDGSGVRLAQELLASGTVRRVVFFSACTDRASLAAAAAVGSVLPKNAGVAALVAELCADTRYSDVCQSGVVSVAPGVSLYA